MAAYIKSDDHLTIVFDNGESTTVYTSNPRYKEIVVALSAKDYELVRKLAVPVAALKDKIQKVVRRTGATVELVGGVVYYNGEAIHNTLSERIVEMSNDGFDIEPMTKFLVNLKQNPSFRAVNELYRFMEKGNLPITEDGYLLAYKKVDENYLDCHTHTIANKIGEVVTMERNLVDEDKSRECSSGLHFCSKDYLNNFTGTHTMIVKINPADVVAIPEDYNSSKGRCCRYEVIGEINGDQSLEGAFRPSDDYVEPPDYTESDDDDYDDDDGYGDDYDYNDGEEDDFEEDYLDLRVIEDANGHISLDLAGVDDVAPAQTEKLLMVDPDTGTVIDEYNSIKEAAEDNGVTVSMISRVLKGDRKTTGGYGWKWDFIETDTPKDPTPQITVPSSAIHDGDRWPYDYDDSEEDEDDDRPW